jgi:hypothetical protein
LGGGMSEIKTASVILTPQEIIDTFVNTHLEGNYDFLQEDLVKLANAFIEKARPKIARHERIECVQFVRSLNYLVGDKLEQKRGKL